MLVVALSQPLLDTLRKTLTLLFVIRFRQRHQPLPSLLTLLVTLAHELLLPTEALRHLLLLLLARVLTLFPYTAMALCGEWDKSSLVDGELK
jgi:hypothetical protein